MNAPTDEQRFRRALVRIAAHDIPRAVTTKTFDGYAQEDIEAEVVEEFAAHVLGGGDPDVEPGYGMGGKT